MPPTSARAAADPIHGIGRRLRDWSALRRISEVGFKLPRSTHSGVTCHRCASSAVTRESVPVVDALCRRFKVATAVAPLKAWEWVFEDIGKIESRLLQLGAIALVFVLAMGHCLACVSLPQWEDQPPK